MTVNYPTTVRGILLAMTGTAVLIGMAGMLLYITQDTTVSLANALPSTGTVAVFQQTSVRDVKRFASLYPVLASLPDGTQAVHIAVIESRAGEQGWVILPIHADENMQAIPGIRVHIPSGTDAIVSSQATAEALMLQKTDRLASRPDYRQLAEEIRAPSWVWVYVPSVRMEALSATDLHILQIIGTTSLASYNGNNQEHVLFLEKERPPFPLSNMTSTAVANPELVVQFKNGVTAWQELMQIANNPQKEWLIEKWVSTVFGTDVSLRYDILPLLNEESAVTLGTGSGSHTTIALRGTASEDSLQMVLQRLHQSVRLSAGNITMLEQNFDSKPPFSIRAVAEGQQKQTVTRTAAGWNILETGGNGSPSLFTATQGRRFIISNDSGALNQLIQNQKNSLELPSPVTFPLSSLRAGGMISPRMRKRLLADEPSILLSLLLPSWTSNSPLLWARRQVGLVGTISLEAISSAAGSQ